MSSATSRSRLREGVREAKVLKASVQSAIDDLYEWLDGPDGIGWAEARPSYMDVAGIRGFAKQLQREMVVKTSA